MKEIIQNSESRGYDAFAEHLPRFLLHWICKFLRIAAQKPTHTTRVLNFEWLVKKESDNEALKSLFTVILSK